METHSLLLPDALIVSISVRISITALHQRRIADFVVAFLQCVINYHPWPRDICRLFDLVMYVQQPQLVPRYQIEAIITREQIIIGCSELVEGKSVKRLKEVEIARCGQDQISLLQTI